MSQAHSIEFIPLWKDDTRKTLIQQLSSKWSSQNGFNHTLLYCRGEKIHECPAMLTYAIVSTGGSKETVVKSAQKAKCGREGNLHDCNSSDNALPSLLKKPQSSKCKETGGEGALNSWKALWALPQAISQARTLYIYFPARRIPQKPSNQWNHFIQQWVYIVWIQPYPNNTTRWPAYKETRTAWENLIHSVTGRKSNISIPCVGTRTGSFPVLKSKLSKHYGKRVSAPEVAQRQIFQICPLQCHHFCTRHGAQYHGWAETRRPTLTRCHRLYIWLENTMHQDKRQTNYWITKSWRGIGTNDFLQAGAFGLARPNRFKRKGQYKTDPTYRRNKSWKRKKVQ